MKYPLSASALFPVLLTCLAATACSSATGVSDAGEEGAGGTAPQPTTTGTGDPPPVVVPVDPPPTNPDGATIIETLPDGFTPGTSGGYQRVDLLENVEASNPDECANVLRAVVRDFEHDHVDFIGPKTPALARGMVGPLGAALGEDRKPVRVEGIHPEVAVYFEDWYHNVPDLNVAYVVDFWLEPVDDAFVFDSSRFFPLEGVGTANGVDDDGTDRNFGFTTELHTEFQYQGGELFTFRGDDDVFVYVDNQLVVDLAGVHDPMTGTLNLDDLGLEVGEVYPIDLFHAERNPTGSNFRIETTLDFTDCGQILPGDVH